MSRPPAPRLPLVSLLGLLLVVAPRLDAQSGPSPAAIGAAPAASPLAATLWREQDGDVHIRMDADANGVITGRIAWVRDTADTPARDTKNPDAALRDRLLLGLPMLQAMKPESATSWVDGTIYDARNGKTYRASMRLAHPDTLLIRGYVKIGFVKLGRTAVWTRISPAQAN